ncbi:MAG: ATP-grasp fold amidoligase family protein [Candidatus Woesearchaeota archaeon]
MKTTLKKKKINMKKNKEILNKILESLSFIPDKFYLKLIYFFKFKKYLNLNKPKSFNEKLQYLKLKQKDKKFSKLSDKYKVKEYVKEKIGENILIKSLWVGKNPTKIPFKKLPKKFIIKINDSSGQNIIVKDKNKINKQDIIKKLNKWMTQKYWKRSRELNYKDIDKKIIVEEFLEDKKTTIPKDYKFFIFNGKAKYIQIDIDRFTKHKRCIYDIKWKKQNFGLEYEFFREEVKKPNNLKKMIQYAEKLANNLPFVRVDFYEVNQKIYFGEITFYPGGGIEKFFPNHDELDLKFGEKIKLK